MSTLESRIAVFDTKVEVTEDLDFPDKTLQYRVVSLSQSTTSANDFKNAPYPFQFDLKRGKVLELREGEEESLQYQEAHQKLKIKLVTHRGYSEISFSANADLHLSRIQLEDPQKHRYSLGSGGTVNEKDKWYLPEDAMFSKKAESTCWHVILDKYSECLFDLIFDD